MNTLEIQIDTAHAAIELDCYSSNQFFSFEKVEKVKIELERYLQSGDQFDYLLPSLASALKESFGKECRFKEDVDLSARLLASEFSEITAKNAPYLRDFCNTLSSQVQKRRSPSRRYLVA